MQTAGAAKPEIFHTAGITTHSCYLNVVLLETRPDMIVPVGLGALDRIEAIRKTRVRDVGLRWDNWEKKVLPGRFGELEEHHYRSRLFVVSGTFDVAAIFFSPIMELSAWVQSAELLVAGQDINMCLLPRADSLWGGGEDRPGGGVDFNAEFLRDYARPHDQRTELLPAETAFVSVTKVKLSPLILWPKPTGDALAEIGQVKAILREIWERVALWRGSTRVGRDRERPNVAVGLAFGWNELLVIAHADSPGKLLRLSLLLRQPTLGIQADPPDPERDESHVVSTTLTVIGHDFHHRQRARRELQDLCRPPKGPGKRSPRPVPVKASKLVDLACELGGDDEAFYGDGDGEAPDTFFQIACHTYPGHEKRLLESLGDLERSLDEKQLLFEGLKTAAIIDVGKRDVWTPLVPIGPEKLSPQQAMSLVGLLQEWIRHGGRGPADSPPTQLHFIPDAFDFYSRIGCLASDPEALGLTPLGKRHILGLPDELLTGPGLRNVLEPPDVKGKAAAAAGAADGPAPRREFVEKILSAMRALQLPYSLSGQILHVVNTLLWANKRETIWDESIELVPAVLALASYLEGRQRWWNEEVLRIADLHRPEFMDLFKERLEEELDKVRGQLQRHADSELGKLSRAFRAYFYNVHFSSYLTGEMPDLNLRYKGSVHQLLRIANMILDALTDVVLGPRACMAIIGDSISPEVSMPCNVTVVQLNSAAFTTPVILETLAHEVAHQFLRELVKDSETARRWRDHPWVSPDHLPEKRRVSYRKVRKAIHSLNQRVFRNRLIHEEEEEAGLFIESAADFLEMRLLEYDFPMWLRSFLLRTVLSARPTSMEVAELHGEPSRAELEQGIRVPSADHEILSAAVTRAVLVYVATKLVDRPLDETFDLEAFRGQLMGESPAGQGTEGKDQRPIALGELRRLLLEECTLGPESKVQETIEDAEKWNKWIRESVVNFVPWLADRYAAASVAVAYKALAAHAEWRPEKSGEVYPNTGRLWPPIRDAFQELWNGPRKQPDDARGQDRDGARHEERGIGRSLLPSLFIRHWMNREQLDDLRKGEDEWPPESFRPWQIDLQPLRGDGDGATVAVKTQIFQRGGIHPADPEAREVWEEAERRFLLRLLLMVPAWHRAVLSKIEHVMGEPDGD